jgi:hypothetical protein
MSFTDRTHLQGLDEQATLAGDAEQYECKVKLEAFVGRWQEAVVRNQISKCAS